MKMVCAVQRHVLQTLTTSVAWSITAVPTRVLFHNDTGITNINTAKHAFYQVIHLNNNNNSLIMSTLFCSAQFKQSWNAPLFCEHATRVAAVSVFTGCQLPASRTQSTTTVKVNCTLSGALVSQVVQWCCWCCVKVVERSAFIQQDHWVQSCSRVHPLVAGRQAQRLNLELRGFQFKQIPIREYSIFTYLLT